MIVYPFSLLKTGDIVIPIKNPLISVMRAENNTVRVIKTNNPEFKIDELITTSGKCICNPNLNINVYIKEYGQIPNKTKFIYDNSIYVKVEIDIGEQCKLVKAFNIESHVIRAIFSSEGVFVIEEAK